MEKPPPMDVACAALGARFLDPVIIPRKTSVIVPP